MRDNHIYASYAIVPPQIDRSKPAHKQSDPTLYAGVVKERDDGIVISGAQQIATGGVLSDWIHLSCIHPLQPGDENYANCVAVPVNAPGVTLIPRRPFALHADNAFDYPLSSRFDESDSYVVFDNVFVPWEHVFIYRNLELTRDQWFKTPSHSLGNHQAQVRYVTKLRFMMGLAQRTIEMIGSSGLPPVQIAMGEIAALVSIYEGMLLAHEVAAPIRGRRAVAVGDHALCGDGDAVGVQRPDARDDPRAGELFGDLAAVVAGRFRQSGGRRPDRALHALGHHGREIAHRAGAAVMGLPRHRVRQPPPAIRKILRRLAVDREAERLSQFRFQAGDGAGRSRAQSCRRWNNSGVELHALSPRGRGRLGISATRMGEGSGTSATPHPSEITETHASPSPARGEGMPFMLLHRQAAARKPGPFPPPSAPAPPPPLPRPVPARRTPSRGVRSRECRRSRGGCAPAA